MSLSLGDLFAVGGGLMGGPWGVQAALGYFGNEQQAAAAGEAQDQNAALIQQGRDAATGAGYVANQLLADAMPTVQGYMGQGYDASADFATQGYGQQRADLLQGQQLGAGAISQGMQGGLGALYGGAGQGIGYINSGTQGAAGAIGDRSNYSAAMLNQPGGLYGNYQADPGYQFRLQQGEDALRRQQAAQGGRFGGAAMKALVDYNQNMASQEFGNYVNRQNSAFGAAQGADSQSLQAQNALAGLYSNAGSQAGNMAYGLGQNAANMYGQGASQLANIYGSTGAQLGAQSAAAGGALGQLAGNYYAGLGNLQQQNAQQMGANITNAAGAGLGVIPAAVSNNNMTIPYAGQGLALAGQAVGGAMKDIASLYAMGGGFSSGAGLGPGL